MPVAAIDPTAMFVVLAAGVAASVFFHLSLEQARARARTKTRRILAEFDAATDRGSEQA